MQKIWTYGPKVFDGLQTGEVELLEFVVPARGKVLNLKYALIPDDAEDSVEDALLIVFNQKEAADAFLSGEFTTLVGLPASIRAYIVFSMPLDAGDEAMVNVPYVNRDANISSAKRRLWGVLHSPIVEAQVDYSFMATMNIELSPVGIY